MGPENSGGPVVAYIDGKPVETGQPPPEITPDCSAGGVSAKEAAESLAAMTAVMADLSMTIEVAAEGIREFFHATELSAAIWVVRIFEPEMVHRYLHTKKADPQEIRKADLAWFREVLE